MSYHILYNPLAASRTGLENAKGVEALLEGGAQITYTDITQCGDLYDYITSLPAEEQVIIAGGDGTLNHLVNNLDGRELDRPLRYFPAGSGNDFAVDLGIRERNRLIDLDQPGTRYLRDLPVITVNGERHHFLNGVGYGIDGYCCEEGDRLRALSDKPVNYTSIAIKGLLGKFHPANARVTVDGVEHTYKKAWLAPIMNGRFYGGGMMVAPDQDRLSSEKTLSVVIMHGSGKLKTLLVFPGIFKGEHVKHTEMVDVLTGHDITVEFDRPTPLQIDGETVSGVTVCHALSGAKQAAAAGV